jgi:YVTN family beta-propeller protein
VIYPFPYTDVSGVGTPFCPGIMEAYVTGVSKGTSPTTFSPNDNVPRVQMTTFLQRALDQGLARSSRRAALNQWWVPQGFPQLQVVAGGTGCASDGTNIWAVNNSSGNVFQIAAGTGANPNTWTGATSASSVLVATGLVFVVGTADPGVLYVFDPTGTPGPVATGSSNLGSNPYGIAFDGTNVWTANSGPPGSVSYLEPGVSFPYIPTTVTSGFTSPLGILYDGAHIWVTDLIAGTLLKLDASGGILQTVVVGTFPWFPVFDGANIWVPNQGSNSLTVVQASTGNVVATINSDATNRLNAPIAASFDGERVLVANQGGNSVTVFKAADLSFIASVPTGTASAPGVACSDGINFWVNLYGYGEMVRF